MQGVSEKDQAVEDILENQDDNIDEELLDQNIEVAPELDQTEEDQGPEEEQFNNNEVEEVVDQVDEELSQDFLEDLYYNKDVEPEEDQTSKELYEDQDQNNSSVLEVDQPAEELFEDQYQINEDQYYDDEDAAEVDNSEEMVEEGILEEPELNEVELSYKYPFMLTLQEAASGMHPEWQGGADSARPCQNPFRGHFDPIFGRNFGWGTKIN